MIFVLWRDRWLKPLNIEELDLKVCCYCKMEFKSLEFVTACEFCEIEMIHDSCANDHLIKNHKTDLKKKANEQKEKQLHRYQ